MELNPLHSLIQLIQFDRQLVTRRQQLRTLGKDIAKLETDIAHLETTQKDAHTHVLNAQKAVHAHELVMKELEAQEQEKKQLLETASSPKTYESLKKEITFIKKREYDYEKEVVLSWKNLETAQKVFVSAQATVDEQSKNLHEKIQEKKQEFKRIEQELTQLNEDRKPLERVVPPDVLEKYNRMNTSEQNAIVPIENGSCSGCFSQLSAQDMLDLKRSKLIQCHSCYRFVYLPEPSQPS